MGFDKAEMRREAVRYAQGMGYTGIVVESVGDYEVRLTVMDADFAEYEMTIDFLMGIGNPRGYLD